MENLDIVELIFALFGVASIIVRATPTKQDDKIVGKFGKFINLVFEKTRAKK